MPSQAFALRDIRLSDLPALKRWRSWPDVQRHLRNPTPPSWWQQLRWWWWQRRAPNVRVWVVTKGAEVVGQAGLYWRLGDAAEVSILVFRGTRENEEDEYTVVHGPLTEKAREWGLRAVWAEVYARAPLSRHLAFDPKHMRYADTYSTIYRWSIG